MKYPVAAFVIQVIALIFDLIVVGLASYAFHYDRKWYNVVQLYGHVYFEPFVDAVIYELEKDAEDVLRDDKEGGFDLEHHRIRSRPPGYFGGNFYRHTKSDEIIYMAAIVLVSGMQLVAVVITAVRKIQFLPEPCTENGAWYLIIGFITLGAVITEIHSRVEIYLFYGLFREETKSADVNRQIGALMLASCGKKSDEYEIQLSPVGVAERDALFVCQQFTIAIVGACLLFISCVLCFVVAGLLYCAWRKRVKENDEEADPENAAEENSENPSAVESSANVSEGSEDENKNPKKAKSRSGNISRASAKKKNAKSPSKSPASSNNNNDYDDDEDVKSRQMSKSPAKNNKIKNESKSKKPSKSKSPAKSKTKKNTDKKSKKASKSKSPAKSKTKAKKTKSKSPKKKAKSKTPPKTKSKTPPKEKPKSKTPPKKKEQKPASKASLKVKSQKQSKADLKSKTKPKGKK